jgi:hypothetical protein
MAYNVPIVYDVATLNASEGWTCALGWRLSSMFLLALPCPPTGGNANQKAKERQRLSWAKGATAPAAYTILLDEVPLVLFQLFIDDFNSTVHVHLLEQNQYRLIVILHLLFYIDRHLHYIIHG